MFSIDPTKLLSAGIGGFSNIFSSLLTGWQNRNMQAEQNAFNREERVAAQDFQDQQRSAQNDWSEGMYTKYESPQARAQAFTEAGLNYRLASDNVGNLGAASGSSGAGMMASPTAPPYLDSTAYSLPFRDIAESLKALGEAEKTGIETKYVKDQLEEELRGMRIANTTQEFMQGLNERYLDEYKSKELAKMAQDIEVGKATEHQIRSTIEKIGKDCKLSQLQIDTYEERFVAEMQKIKSEIELNESSKRSIDQQTDFDTWKGVVGNLETGVKDRLDKLFNKLHDPEVSVSDIKDILFGDDDD